jgi:type VII secretion-associated serine protease mycosin
MKKPTSSITIAAIMLALILLNTPVVTDAAKLPNDPYLSEQWGWFDIHADKAYATGYQGKGVVVAVLDTGVDHKHPDLKANIVEGWNFVDNNNETTDLDGHGTHVAGIIAATTNNGIGIAGIAPEAKIMPLKVLSKSGGAWINLDKAILYAANHGVEIISMSLGGQVTTVLSPTVLAAIFIASQKNVTLIASAGNENTNSKSYPAAYPNVIAVSAISKNHSRASFSNYGNYITFTAPGVNILSTMPTYPVTLTTQYDLSENYDSLSGTSMACPFVSGVVALLLSKYPSLTPNMVKDTLAAQAMDLGEKNWDPYFGYGIPDAYMVVTETPIPEFGNMSLLLIVSASILFIIFCHKKSGEITSRIEKGYSAELE